MEQFRLINNSSQLNMFRAINMNGRSYKDIIWNLLYHPVIVLVLTSKYFAQLCVGYCSNPYKYGNLV